MKGVLGREGGVETRGAVGAAPRVSKDQQPPNPNTPDDYNHAYR